MPNENLVPTFVGQDRRQREIVRITVFLKGFRINDQQILLCSSGLAILGTTRVTVHVPVFNNSDKPEPIGNAHDSVEPGTLLPCCESRRLPSRHAFTLPIQI